MTREQLAVWVTMLTGGVIGFVAKPNSLIYYSSFVIVSGCLGYAIKGLIDELGLND